MKPRIVISACLAGDKVRYNGKFVKDNFVIELIPYIEVVKICPEVGVNLGVPREKIILYQDQKRIRAFQPSTGRDLTKEIEDYSLFFLKSVSEVDGFLLKSKSPSCGVSLTKIFKDPEGIKLIRKGKGLFAKKVKEFYPLLPVADEIQLRRKKFKLRFLISVFTLAQLRTCAEIEDFHFKISRFLQTFYPRTERKLRSITDRDLYRIYLLKILRKTPLGILQTHLTFAVPQALLKQVLK